MTELLVSADSHVMEDPELWVKELPQRFNADAPIFPPHQVGTGFQGHEGGRDPKQRIVEMAKDGVVQEILYPTLALNLFGMTDAALQEACFGVYNDWLIEYCSQVPGRLFGIGNISTFNIEHAVAELIRCHEAGLVGAAVWEVPPDDINFATSHYDPLWEVAESLRMPINLHILTGTSFPWPRPEVQDRYRLQRFARHSNDLVFEAANTMGDLISTGVLERFPDLHFVIVESEASWVPLAIHTYDKYASRSYIQGSPLSMKPSEYFERNFHVTFFNDPILGLVLQEWGQANCMWSNDFPHPNSTWPSSREVIERHLGHLPTETQERLVRGNVTKLYGLPEMALTSSAI